MIDKIIDKSFFETYFDIIHNIEILWPKLVWAVLILIVWWILSRILYVLSFFVFRKLKLNQLIDKLKINFDEEMLGDDWEKIKKKIKKTRFTDKVKVDNVVAKSISYYLMIVFLRIAISYIWITDIEKFLSDLIEYLPNLFIWVTIWFFGIRFSNFIYDVIYHTLHLSKEKTAKIIAHSWKIMILFFTLMIFLDYTKIVSTFIINTVLIWFISMISLAWWLAFWLWWKEIAQEIIESFRNN